MNKQSVITLVNNLTKNICIRQNKL